MAILGEIRAGPDPDPVLMAEVLSLAHHCLLGPDLVRLRRELAAELIKASFRTERRGDLLMGLLWRTVDSFADGDPHAERLLGELRDHLTERDHLAIAFVVSAIDVMLAIRAGRFDEAEAAMAEALKQRPGSKLENIGMPRKNTSPLWLAAAEKIGRAEVAAGLPEH